MSKLQMPRKGQSAAMMAELQAEHAAATASGASDAEHVTTLQPADVTENVLTPEAATVATTEPSPVTANALTPVLTNEPASVPSLGPYTEATSAQQSPKPTRKRPASPAPADESRPDRLALAMERAAQDAIAVVTVRVPAGLNRYMDDYVARINRVNPQGRYRKQDAVEEAFAAFYADHIMPPAPVDEDL
jgi:hypothetical protein